MMSIRTIILLFIIAHHSASAQKTAVVFEDRFITSSDTLFSNHANTMRIVNLPINSIVTISIGKLKPKRKGLLQVELHDTHVGKNTTLNIIRNDSILFSKTFFVAHKPIVKIRIGNNGRTEIINGIYNMKAEDLMLDGIIQLLNTSTNTDIKISNFELSMIPNRGELIGPILIQGNNITNIKTLKEVVTFRKGDRLLLENISIDCTCIMEKRVLKRYSPIRIYLQ